MKRKIKWGIISTAKIAETDLIPAIKKSKNSELVAVASRNKDKAAKNVANNTKQVFGALPATLWAPRDIGYSTTGV